MVDPDFVKEFLVQYEGSLPEHFNIEAEVVLFVVVVSSPSVSCLIIHKS